MPNLVYRFSYIVRRRLQTIYDLLQNEGRIGFPTNQSGIAQIILVLFLLAGIGIGTYIVQNRTSFLPHAQEDYVPWDNPPEESQPDQPDEDAPGDQGGSGGERASDGQSLESQDSETQRMFRDTYCPGNDGTNCDAAKKQWVSEHNRVVVSVNSDKVTTSDGQSLTTQDKDTQRAFSAAYCGGNAEANCEAAKEQWAKEHVVDVANGGKALTEEQRLAEEKEAADRNKATLDASRTSLDPDGIYKNEGADAYVAKCLESGKSQEECDNRKRVLEEIIKAQEAHDYAVTTKFDNPVTQTAAYDQAKLLARAANCDAVAAGIPGSNCVLDMGDTSNIITATVNDRQVRVFLGCSTVDFNEQGSCRKVLNYRPAGCSIQNDNLTKPECKPKELPEDAAKALGINDPRNVYNIADLPPAVLKSGVDYCQATGGACILAGQSSALVSKTPPATKTAGSGYTLPTGHQLTSTGNEIPGWKPPAQFSTDCKPSEDTPEAVGKAIACEYKKAGGTSVKQLAGAVGDFTIPNKITQTAYPNDSVQRSKILAVMAAVKDLGGSTDDIVYSGFNTGLSKRCPETSTDSGCASLVWQWALEHAKELSVNNQTTAPPETTSDCRVPKNTCISGQVCIGSTGPWRCNNDPKYNCEPNKPDTCSKTTGNSSSRCRTSGRCTTE